VHGDNGMSENNSGKINSLDSKMKDLSDYLRKSVLDPADEERRTIVENAEKQASLIIEKAEKEASEIIKKAQIQSDNIKAKTDSALNIARRQTVDTLKSALEKEILSSVVEKPVKAALKSEELIKGFVAEVLKIYSSDAVSYELSLSGEMKEKLNDYLVENLGKVVEGGIKLSDENLPTGFAVSVDGSGLRFDFKEESVVELLTEYIRPELRKLLFTK
jgi:vacuolar-type H+-ATPase subunit E/Vma4